LYQEFMEDVFEANPEYARLKRLEHFGMEIAPTGDPLVDMWERQIANGEEPDMDVGEDDKARKRDAWVREQARKHLEETGEKIYIAPLPPVVAYMEAMREERDPLGMEEGRGAGAEADLYLGEREAYDPSTDDDGYGSSQFRGVGERLVDQVPRGAFDAFVGTAGLFKKR